MGLFDSLKKAASGVSGGLSQQMGSMMGGGSAQALAQDSANAWSAIYKDEMQLETKALELQTPEHVKKIHDGGYHTLYYGTYKDIPIEWHQIMYMYYKGGSTYIVDERKLIFTVPSVGDWFVTMSPRVKGMQGGVTTGVESFDENIHVSTNDEARLKEVFSREWFQEFGDRGWVSLKLEKESLILNDDFMNQFYTTQATAGMKMASSVHPYWGFNMLQPIPQKDLSMRVINAMIDVAKKIGA